MNWEEIKKEMNEKEHHYDKKRNIDDNPTSINTVNGIPFSEWILSKTQSEVIELLESLGNRRDLSILD